MDPRIFITSKNKETPYIDNLFRIDKELEAAEATTGKKVHQAFQEKGGVLHVLKPGSENKFTFLPGDVVYPSCSAGFNRSQTLWMLLSKFGSDILLLPPHATRMGFDPYNEKVNWHKNDATEAKEDEFEKVFMRKKITRVGFEHFSHLRKEMHVHADMLREIWQYYTTHYFGPESLPNEKSDPRRVYITFAGNTHVIMNRLCESNDRLSKVTVVSIDMDDLVNHPMAEWNAAPRSITSYKKVTEIFQSLLDLSKLQEAV